MAFKEFTAARREEDRDPISFGIDGQVFRCADEMPWPLLEQVLSCVTMSPSGEVSVTNGPGLLLQVGSFFRALVLDEDLPTLEEIMNRKRDAVSIAQLAEIMAWLVETYVGRPTMRPKPSSAGPSTTGQKSRVVSLSQGWVREVDSDSELGQPEPS